MIDLKFICLFFVFDDFFTKKNMLKLQKGYLRNFFIFKQSTFCTLFIQKIFIFKKYSYSKNIHIQKLTFGIGYPTILVIKCAGCPSFTRKSFKGIITFGGLTFPKSDEGAEVGV